MGLRVLHVSQSQGYGITAYLRDVVKVQTAAGWSVAVASGESFPGAESVPWTATRDPGPSTVAETAALARIVRRVQPDVVHLHSSKAGVAGRMAVRGRRPTIFQPHAWSFNALGGPKRTLALGWERWGARWADVVLCVSESERRQGEGAGVAPPRYAVIPNAVDTDRFAPGDRRAARTRLGLSDEGPLAVCVARLTVWQKGQDVLLAAWPAVAAAVPGAALALVGDGPDEGMLRAMAGEGGSVRFVGAVEPEDVPDWLRAADVVVQPSRYEGLSIAVLEALACGRPVVAGDAVGMREAIGEGGAVVPVGDAQALAHALIARLRDPAQAEVEGATARARAVQHYDRRAWAQALVALTEQVAAGRPTS